MKATGRDLSFREVRPRPSFDRVLFSLAASILVAGTAGGAGFLLGAALTIGLPGEASQAGLIVAPVLAFATGAGMFALSFRHFLRRPAAGGEHSKG